MESLHMNDPRNYKFLPPTFTKVIKPAGKQVKQSEHAANLLNLGD